MPLKPTLEGMRIAFNSLASHSPLMQMPASCPLPPIRHSVPSRTSLAITLLNVGDPSVSQLNWHGFPLAETKSAIRSIEEKLSTPSYCMPSVLDGTL